MGTPEVVVCCQKANARLVRLLKENLEVMVMGKGGATMNGFMVAIGREIVKTNQRGKELNDAVHSDVGWHYNRSQSLNAPDVGWSPVRLKKVQI